MEQEIKLYVCEAKGCRFIFESESMPERCPDCGKKKLRLANSREITEYEQRKNKSLLTKYYINEGEN